MTDQIHGPRRYLVKHVTTYRYVGGDVSACFQRGMLELRATRSQSVVSSDIRITPVPSLMTTSVDHFGNERFYAEITTPYRKLSVVKSSVVDVDWPAPDPVLLHDVTVREAAERLRSPSGGLGRLERSELSLPSPRVGFDPAVVDFAHDVLRPDQPLADAVEALIGAIHDGFAYRPGATSIRTTLPEVLRMRAGVCQDFAHLAAGCLRIMGLPVRYVSGYLETQPPPGRAKLAGSDATHAWASVAVPGAGGGVEWLDLDPTNDQLADSRYIVTGWGRDFTDVSPLRGVVFGESASASLKVGVDVVRVPDDAGDAPGEIVAANP